MKRKKLPANGIAKPPWPIPTQGAQRLAPTRFGPMLFNPLDRYVGRSLDLYGEFSPGEAELFSRLLLPGAVAVDAGAHVGALTLALAHTVGPRGGVLAFEPQRLLFQTLCANVTINGLNHVWTYHAALGETKGEVSVPVLDPNQESNFAGLSLTVPGTGETVPRTSLDALELARCHFIKVDVEGMEREVLDGARRTIERFRPVLYVENDRRERSAALIDRILGFDYDLYWHLPPLFSPNNFNGVSQNVFGDTVSVNMLCFPRSAAARVTGLRPVTGPDHWILDTAKP